MASKANRRGSVEVQQLALWKHQQNLEEIKMLKANNSLPPPPPAAATMQEASPFSPEAQSKLSKLAARKNKGASEPVKPAVQTNISHIMTDIRDHVPHQQIEPHAATQHKPIFDNPAARQGNNVASNDAAHRGDLEALLKEKQQWLRTIHEDNGKMAKMLKDLQEAKLALSKKIDDIETERKSMQQAAAAGNRNVLEEVEIFLREDSDLSEKKRDLALPAAQLEPAAELLRELLVVAGQFRLNQGETREFFYKTVRQTVNSFVTAALAEEERDSLDRDRDHDYHQHGGGGTEDGTENGAVHSAGASAKRAQAELSHQMEILRALAATGPGNIRAAESVAASVASALIRAAGERTVDLMQLHQTAVDKRQQQGLKDELLALQKENQELKTSLAQLRKSNVQLRMKAATTMMMPSARRAGPGSVTSGGGGGVAEGKEGESTYGDGTTAPGNLSTSAAGVLDDGLDRVLLEHDRPLSPTQAQDMLLASAGTPGAIGGNRLQSSERLPKSVERYLQKELAQHAQLVIEGHPLASTLTEAMVGNLSKELSREVQGIAAAAFFAFMHHRLGQAELPQSLLDGTITSISVTGETAARLSEADRKVCEQVQEAVEHVLQVSSVHTEMSALVTLYLTYLHCRPKNQATDATQDEQQRMLAGIADLPRSRSQEEAADPFQGVLLMEDSHSLGSRRSRGTANGTGAGATTAAGTEAAHGAGNGAQAAQSSPRSPVRAQAQPSPASHSRASLSSPADFGRFGGAALAATAVAKMRKAAATTASAGAANGELGTSLLDNSGAPLSPGASLPRYMQAKSKR